MSKRRNTNIVDVSINTTPQKPRKVKNFVQGDIVTFIGKSLYSNPLNNAQPHASKSFKGIINHLVNQGTHNAYVVSENGLHSGWANLTDLV